MLVMDMFLDEGKRSLFLSTHDGGRWETKEKGRKRRPKFLTIGRPLPGLPRPQKSRGVLSARGGLSAREEE